LNEIECVAHISEVIKSIDNTFNVPVELKDLSEINCENQWDIIQAQKWEKENYREKYLNHEFGEVETIKETTKRELSEQEKEEEKLVENYFIGYNEKKEFIQYNLLNKHQRDERVKFYPEPHIYEIDGIIADSATTIISKFFPEFDPDYVIYKMKNGKNWGPNNKYFRMSDQEIKDGWNKKGNIALEKGSLLHEQIENFYLQKEYQETEVFYQFKEFF